MGRRYGLGGPWVLRGGDLDLRAGTPVRVRGSNGSGKSTLLRLLAGIDAPTEGRITGRPRTAYVPERFPAALPFTAAGYLTRLGRVHGLGRREAAAGAAEWLERFGAAAHARTPLGELSRGTSQKVAVAQALLAGPELLVLDEAWTGLTPRHATSSTWRSRNGSRQGRPSCTSITTRAGRSGWPTPSSPYGTAGWRSSGRTVSRPAGGSRGTRPGSWRSARPAHRCPADCRAAPNSSRPRTAAPCSPSSR